MDSSARVLKLGEVATKYRPQVFAMPMVCLLILKSSQTVAAQGIPGGGQISEQPWFRTERIAKFFRAEVLGEGGGYRERTTR